MNLPAHPVCIDLARLLDTPMVDREPTVEALDLWRSEGCLAQRAVQFLASPLFDTVRVEVMTHVTGQRRYFISVNEVTEADYAFSVFAESIGVDLTRHLFECHADSARLVVHIARRLRLRRHLSWYVDSCWG